MTVFEMAKKYYPRLWDIKRIEALYEAGKLTEEEYNELVNSQKTKEKGEIIAYKSTIIYKKPI